MKALRLHASKEPKTGYTLSEFEIRTGKIAEGSKVWRHPELRIEEVEKPKLGPKDLLIRVKACGICGSDVHFYETDEHGYMLYPGLTRFPCIIGHEFSGEVEGIGQAVKDLKVGDSVTAEEMLWCGECLPCRNGFPNHCKNLEELGFTVDGAMGEYVKVEAKYCWKIDSLMDIYKSEEKVYEAGSLVEPTSVAYNAMFIRAGGFKPGAYVVVYGTGPIGLASIQLAKAAGASRIIAFEAMPQRMNLAREIGADYVFIPKELEMDGTSPCDKIMEITDGSGADMQVEAAGAPTQTLPDMEKALAINGRIVWIGRAAKAAPISMERFQTRRGQIFGSQGHSGHEIFQNVIRLMASGRIDMTRIITKRFKLSEGIKALKEASKRIDAKITVKPGD